MKSIITSLILTALAASSAHAGWSEPVRISEPGGGYNPQIIAQGDTLHVAFTLTGAREKLCYLKSTNGGISWSQQLMISDTIYSGAPSHPRLILSGNRLMAIWRVYVIHGAYHENLGYNTSTNNGRTWSSPGYVLNNNLEWGFVYSASGDGSIVNIMATCPLTDTLTFYNIRSTNFGQSWSMPHEIFRPLISDVPDLISVNNFVHLVWAGYFNQSEAGDVYYNRSTDGGLSWTGNIPLSTIDNYPSELSSICSSGDSALAACWMDFKYSPYMVTGDILVRSSSDFGQTWGPEREATFDHFAWNSDIESNGDTIHIVWQDEIHDPAHLSIYYTRSTDNGENWSEPYWIDGTLDDSVDPAMAVSNGRVYVVWADGRVNPDTSLRSGLYISRYDPDNDAVNDENINNFPKKVSLSAYPNPFNSSITITYSNLNGREIGIYDIQGKLIKTLKTDRGENGKIIWDATDALGNRVSSGIYFAKVINNADYIRLIYMK